MALVGYARDASELGGLRSSPRESARFGFAVGRLDIAEAGISDPARVLQLFRGSDAEICFLRYPASQVGWAAELNRSDVTALVADSLLYFRRARTDPVSGAPSAAVVGRDELDRLEACVRATFPDYANHYRSNPILGRAEAESGYVEWAGSLVAEPDSAVLWGGDPGDPTGFGAVQWSGGEGEVALAGILPAARGTGAYDRLLADLESHLWAEGAQHVVISTQSWNLVPMRVWIRRGYEPHEAFTTVHLLRGRARQRYLDLAVR
jgi:GNAT superfamily N-acetyltransferase